MLDKLFSMSVEDLHAFASTHAKRQDVFANLVWADGFCTAIELVRQEARLTKRALDGRKCGAKSKSLNGKGGSKAARQ